MAYGHQHPDILKFKKTLFDDGYIVIGLTAETISETTDLKDVIYNELSEENGYFRLEEILGTGTIDNVTLTYPTVTFTFTAYGASLNWNSVFVMLGGDRFASRSFVGADINTGTDRITINDHGFTNGDRIIVRPDSLSTIFGGASLNTYYYVNGIDTNTIELYTNNELTSLLNITNNGGGSANYELLSCNGYLLAYIVEDSPVTLLDGSSYSYTFNLNEVVYYGMVG